MLQDGFLAAVLEAKEHILAGDIFQLVMSQRFERRTFADPFEVYRALRVVNPSPYMVYMQVRMHTHTHTHTHTLRHLIWAMFRIGRVLC